MPLDRSKIRKGAFMTSTPAPDGYVARRARDDDEKLRREFPEFENVMKAAGPSHGPDFEREMAGIKVLAARLEAVRQQLKKVRGK
jgi:hypothetical protein